MTEPKFTRGPWHWELTGGPLDPPQLEGNIEYSDCNPILMCAGCKPSCMKHKNEPCPLVPSKADQSLIAAAPDMYEALILMCNDCSYKSAYECRVCPTGQALRKARGESE